MEIRQNQPPSEFLRHLLVGSEIAIRESTNMRLRGKLLGRLPRYMMLLLAFSIFIGAIPVLSLGLYSYYIAAGDVEQKTKESNMQLLSQTQMFMEQLKKTTELTGNQFARSPLVAAALSGPIDVEEHVQIRDLYSGLYNLQTFSSVSEAYLIDQQHDWVLNFTSVSSLSELAFKDQLVTYANHPNNMFWDTGYIQAAGEDGELTVGKETIRLVQKLPILPFTHQPKGFLIIEIYKPRLRTMLTDSTKEQMGKVYVMDHSGIDFLAKNDEEVSHYSSMNKRIAEAIAETGKLSGYIYGRIDNEDMVFTYRQSTYNEWIYVSAVSLKELTRQTKKIATGTVVACSLVFFIVGLLAWFISRRMYSPIRRLAEMTETVSIGETGSKDEFTSLEKRFHILFSTGQQMQQQMQDQLTQLKQFLMLKLLAGQLSESEFMYRSRLFGFPTGWRRLAVLTLQIDTLQDTRYRDHDKELLLFAIQNMVGELIPSHQLFSPVLLNQSQVNLVASELEDEAELKEYYHHWCELIKAKVQEFLQVSISIGISSPFERTSHVVRAYNESLEALKRHIYLGSGMIIHYGDMDTGLTDMAPAAYTQIKWTEDQLVQALNFVDIEKAYYWFDKYISELSESNLSVKEYPVFMMQLVSRLYQLVQEKGGTVHNVLGERASYARLMRLNVLEDISEWFKRDLIGPVGVFLTSLEDSQYVSIANKIIQMIKEGYNQDITLEGCADELKFHPVYLGRVFKRETGLTFSEYLVNYRMTLAKEWLETTSMKVSDISDKLNYSNTTAFIRSFRKVVGVTPGQFRENNQKQA
jgi:two-component system, response regulator YesN